MQANLAMFSRECQFCSLSLLFFIISLKILIMFKFSRKNLFSQSLIFGQYSRIYTRPVVGTIGSDHKNGSDSVFSRGLPRYTDPIRSNFYGGLYRSNPIFRGAHRSDPTQFYWRVYRSDPNFLVGLPITPIQKNLICQPLHQTMQKV